MAIKKSQIEDKVIKPDKESESDSSQIRENTSTGSAGVKKENGKEYNYPEHNITVKAKNKKEADKKLKEIIN